MGGSSITPAQWREAIEGVRRSEEAMMTGIFARPSARTTFSPPSSTTGIMDCRG